MPAPGNKSPDGRHCSGNGVQHIVGYKNMLLNPFVQCFHVKIIITLLVLLLRGGSVVVGGEYLSLLPTPHHHPSVIYNRHTKRRWSQSLRLVCFNFTTTEISFRYASYVIFQIKDALAMNGTQTEQQQQDSGQKQERMEKYEYIYITIAVCNITLCVNKYNVFVCMYVATVMYLKT